MYRVPKWARSSEDTRTLSVPELIRESLRAFEIISRQLAVILLSILALILFYAVD